MLKLLLFFVLMATTHSETIEWFNGRWLPIVMYSNTIGDKPEEWVGWHGDGYIGLWTGWFLQSKDGPRDCGWMEFALNTSQQCICGDKKGIPVMQVTDLADLDKLEFYKFRYNESRPVIVVKSVDELEEALTATCTCAGKDATQLVFRKTSHNYLVAYEHKDRTATSPNMTLVMTRYVPTISELHKATHVTDELYSMSSTSDTPYQTATLMCDPTFFDDSAYVVGDDGNDSPFITLGFLKNDNDEQTEAVESTTQASDENFMLSTQANVVESSTQLEYGEFETTTINEDYGIELSTRFNEQSSTARTETINWYNGRWLPIVLYSNTLHNKSQDWIGWHGHGYIGLWTGWLLQSKYEPKECGWLEFTHVTNQRCTCGKEKDIPLVRVTDLANLDSLEFYKFRYNETRPVIIVDNVEDVEGALSANCTCSGVKKTQLVFRKTSNNYLFSYENKERTDTGPNMTLVMVRYVPTMSELQLVTHSPSRYWDMPYQPATLMCDPTFFDDSAYVVGDDGNDSPFITLGDLKNDSYEPKNDDETSMMTTNNIDDVSTQSTLYDDVSGPYIFESTTRVKVDKSIQATSNVAVSSSRLWISTMMQIAGKVWLENRIRLL